MSNDHRRKLLEMYLRDKKAQGSPLPGIKGKVNYKGIAIEIGIPMGYFAPGSELRMLINESIEELGASTAGRTDQPRRALAVAALPPALTFDQLKEYGPDWLRNHNYSTKSVATYLSHLNGYIKYLGFTGQDLAAEGFGETFNISVDAFLASTGRGKAARSMLRTWLSIVELHQIGVAPSSFAMTLTDLMRDRGQNVAQVARNASLQHTTLWSWKSGDTQPASPEAVARLERALGVPHGMLSSKLTFYKIRRALNVPKAWWPDTWQKHFGNYRHLRNRVINAIPDHLLTEQPDVLKPAFDAALRGVLDGVGQLPDRKRATRMTKKTYRLPSISWPQRLAEEFADLAAYKTAPNSLSNRYRGLPWADSTVPIAREYLESFFGYLLLPTDNPDPHLTGFGVQANDLTLGWLAVPQVVEKYLDFRRLRSGAHNGVTESFVRTWTSQLQPQGGWLWLHPELLNYLPKTHQRLIQANGSWQAHCEKVLIQLRTMLASLRRNGEIKKSRETMVPIWPILDHPEPLTLINRALALNKRDLEARVQYEGLMSWKLSTAWRDHVLISFLARLPLRSKHWGRLTYREDNTGSLQVHPRDGWRLVIPYDDFKNVRNTTIFTVHSRERVLILKFSELEPLAQLVPLLERYLAEIRPIIAGQGDFLFPTRGGQAINQDLIYRQVSNWTREYLSQHSSRGLGIAGVFPFGPHAFRDIVATHIIKTTGSISLAANILLDSEEMVRQHYARFLPEDRLKLAMAGLAEVFTTDSSE